MISESAPVAILAGGLATRLRPLTADTPKSLVPINGRPFISHQLELLRASGITRVVICVGFMGDRIMDFVGTGRSFGIDVKYSSEEGHLLGTGGALRQALPLLGESFFSIYGDSYLRCDFRAVFDAFRKSERLALMTVFRNENKWDTSNVDFCDGRIRAYSKRQATASMHYIDYGLGVFHVEAFKAVPPATAVDLAAVYQDLLASDELAGYEVSNRFYEMGSWRGIEELSAFLRQRGQSGNRRTENAEWRSGGFSGSGRRAEQGNYPGWKALSPSDH